MSATDELRRLLDERGVEYETYIEQPTGFEHVKWNFNEHGSADFNLEFGEPWLTMYGVISGPEQAIAATLGTGTCKLDGYTDAAFRVAQAPDETDFIDYAEVCECTACGASVIVPHEYERISCERDELWPTYNYCPHCGAKVIAPTTNNIDVEAGE